MTMKLRGESVKSASLASSTMLYPTELTNRGQEAIVIIPETHYDPRNLGKMHQESVCELKAMPSIMLPWKQLPGARRQQNHPETQSQPPTNPPSHL